MCPLIYCIVYSWHDNDLRYTENFPRMIKNTVHCLIRQDNSSRLHFCLAAHRDYNSFQATLSHRKYIFHQNSPLTTGINREAPLTTSSNHLSHKWSNMIDLVALPSGWLSLSHVMMFHNRLISRRPHIFTSFTVPVSRAVVSGVGILVLSGSPRRMHNGLIMAQWTCSWALDGPSKVIPDIFDTDTIKMDTF